MYFATIIKTEYDDEERLIITDAEGNEIVNQYFDPCEPYITPSELLEILNRFGIKCLKEYKEED